MKYKHIIFDIDGTLVDNEQAVLYSLQEVLREELGKEYSFDELRFALGIPGEDALEKLEIEDIPAMMEAWIKIFYRYTANMSVYDGIEELLENFSKEGYRLGIVSSKSKEIFEHDFCKFPIRKYFDVVICQDDTKEHKPMPEPLLKYMELSGTNPNEILYVGDSVYDSKCAKGAGADFALAVWGSHTKDIEADYYPQKPADLPSMISGS